MSRPRPQKSRLYVGGDAGIKRNYVGLSARSRRRRRKYKRLRERSREIIKEYLESRLSLSLSRRGICATVLKHLVYTTTHPRSSPRSAIHRVSSRRERGALFPRPRDYSRRRSPDTLVNRRRLVAARKVARTRACNSGLANRDSRATSALYHAYRASRSGLDALLTSHEIPLRRSLSLFREIKRVERCCYNRASRDTRRALSVARKLER